MPSESVLTLYIPDLFGFQSILPTLSKDELSQLPQTRFPVLEKWLARGLKQKSSDDLLLSEFGIKLEDNQTHAALSLLAEEGIEYEQGNSYWLRADPVYLQADRDTALLLAHEEIELTQDEASKLVNDINQHFSDEPWQLHAPHPHRWYLKAEQQQNLKTYPVTTALANDIKEYAFRGSDADYWLKITNEVQMLLHSASVNFERESRGKLTANSVWLWGGGSLPENKENTSCKYTQIITNNIYYEGVAKYCDINVIPLNTEFSARSFVVLDMLSKPVQQRDLYTFMQVLNEIEDNILAICQDLLNKDNVKEIKLISNHSFAMTITSKSLRRWWKRIKPFTVFKL